MDPLSQICRTLDVRGSLFSRAEATAPFGFDSGDLAFAVFHVILEGEVQVHARGTWHPLSTGDLVVLPHADRHLLCDVPGRATRCLSTLPRTWLPSGLPCVRIDGGGAPASILCGRFDLAEEGSTFLRGFLPPVLIARGEKPWLAATLTMLADEADGARPGATYVRDRLADLLFVQALRAWAEDQPMLGWITAFEDPRLGKALAGVHHHPEVPWTGTTLAREAGMSRSAFFDSFQRAVGVAPSTYLTRWRMVLARRYLRRPEVGLAEVAERIGYTSEAAFSRAFKREVGLPPGTWRQGASTPS